MSESTAVPWHRVAMAGLAFTWAGLVLGLSFLEAPLKFQAPGITRELGLGIGQIVFGALNRIEIGFSLVALLIAVLWRPGTLPRIVLACVLLLVLLQSLWLLPVLDARTVLILGGVEPAPSYHHVLFIGVEAAKVVGLLVLGVLTARR